MKSRYLLVAIMLAWTGLYAACSTTTPATTPATAASIAATTVISLASTNFQLKYRKASDAVRSMEYLFSVENSDLPLPSRLDVISAYADTDTNTVIIKGRPRVVANAIWFLNQIDQPIPNGTAIHMFFPSERQATDLAPLIMDIYSGKLVCAANQDLNMLVVTTDLETLPSALRTLNELDHPSTGSTTQPAAKRP